MPNQTTVHVEAVKIVRDIMAKTIRESSRNINEDDIKLNLSMIASEAVTRIERLKG